MAEGQRSSHCGDQFLRIRRNQRACRVEEAPRLPAPADEATGLYLLPISAGSTEGLHCAARDYQAFLADEQSRQSRMSDICYTASVLRAHHGQRMALVATSREQMVEKISHYLHAAARSELALDRQRKPKIGFIFSGQGSQWLGMGRELLEHDALFRSSMTQCDEWLRLNAGWSPIEVLIDESQAVAAGPNRNSAAGPVRPAGRAGRTLAGLGRAPRCGGRP